MSPSAASTSLRWRIAVVIWMAAIFAVSASPGAASAYTAKLFGGWNAIARTLAHVVEFGILGLLWVKALQHPGYPVLWHHRGLACLFTVLYAISDEVHQFYVPDRFGIVEHVMVDSVGGMLFILLASRCKWG